jgi:Xaa-Pro dipeptidase
MSEHVDRIEKLRKATADAGLDAFLVTSKDSIYYLTGFTYEPFERPFFIIVRPDEITVFVTPRIEAENMASIKIEHRIVEYIDFPAMPGGTYIDALKEVIHATDKIGVEPSLPSETFNTLDAFAPMVAPLVEVLRLIKSPYEIQRIEQAAKFSDLGIKMIMEASRIGVSIAECYGRIPELREAIVKDAGFFDQYTSSIWLGVWAAPFSAQPHRFPEVTDVIKEGPNVGLSFLRVNGYSAETERTYFAHTPSSEEAGIFDTIIEAAEIAYRMLRPGVSAHDVDHAVMTFLRAEGFENNLLHRVGHGIGMSGHEGPWIAEGSDHVLVENMVISVEPGIYWRGKGGYRHSDTVLITSDGYRKLTKMPSDLASMTLPGN